MIRHACQNNTTGIAFDAIAIAVPFGNIAPIRQRLEIGAWGSRLRRRGPGFWLAIVVILLGDAALAGLARIAVDFIAG